MPAVLQIWEWRGRQAAAARLASVVATVMTTVGNERRI